MVGRPSLFMFVLMLLRGVAYAQEPATVDPPAGHDMSQHQHEGGAGAGVPLTGSGTGWLPASTPMQDVHVAAGPWTVMLHGQAFLQAIHESGEQHRRASQAGSINWFMAMADRPLGAGQLRLRGMVSAEPWTIPGCGYPDLLATGEICDGDDIHDKQHPHELFMEVAARYERPLAGALRWHVYGGPAGEPALGPVAFQHRPAAAWNPIAPMTHHWLDSTHISFGVMTTGLSTSRWNAEVSAFNGREPDARRTDFDLGTLDSVAGRLSFAPSPNLVVQISAGHLRDAEQGAGTRPRVNVDRGTASAIYARPLAGGRLLAATLAWGVNSENTIIPGAIAHETTHAVLSEASLSSPGHSWFGRLEIGGKSGESLHIHEEPATVFTVSKLETGYVKHLWQAGDMRVGAGGSLMASIVPDLLAPRYGGNVAPGVAAFLVVSPH